MPPASEISSATALARPPARHVGDYDGSALRGETVRQYPAQSRATPRYDGNPVLEPHLNLPIRATGINIDETIISRSFRWNLPGQYINITGLSPGRYRLKGVADPAGWFREENNANNSTWVNIQLTRHGVRVLKHGPSA